MPTGHRPEAGHRKANSLVDRTRGGWLTERSPTGERALQRPADFVLLGLFFGIATGVAEVAARFLASHIRDVPFDEVGISMVWTIPASNILLFGTLGLLIAAAGIRWRGDKFGRGALVAFVTVAAYALLLQFGSLYWIGRILLSLGVGIQIGSFLSNHSNSVRRFVRAATLPAIALPVLTAFAFRVTDVLAERRAVAGLARPQAHAPNVLLIVLDAVRAEDLSLYGYSRATTPNLTRLASKSVVFDRAISAAPWTLPSHASMFTGHYPHEMSADWTVPLDGTYPTLAERFRARGYATAGFVGNQLYGVPEFGLGRGFTHYEARKFNLGKVMATSTLGHHLVNRTNRWTHSYYRPGRRDAAEMNRRLLEWLPKRGARPFFAFVNLFDAHEPYEPPAPYDMEFSRTEPPTRASRNERLNEAETRGLRDAYDGALVYLDLQLGHLFRELDRRGELSNTLLIVTSDHGEEFGEHGWVSHGNGLYYPVLHVPLLISFPGRVPGGVRVTEPVTLRDLGSTVLDLVGPGQSGNFPGRSLSAHWRGTSSSKFGPESPLLAEVARAQDQPDWYAVSKGAMHSIIVGRHHYILNGDGREELYDIIADPWETTDLVKVAGSETTLGPLRAALASAVAIGVSFRHGCTTGTNPDCGK